VEKHYILGLERKASGAFEHAWNLGAKLNEKGYPTKYFSHWWGNNPKNVSFNDESSTELKPEDLQKIEGIFHLQTHIWEESGYLEKIAKNINSKIIYTIHAIIPYFYLNGNEKELFLEGKLEQGKYDKIINEKMSKREQSQLTAINRANYLFVIAENHRKVLQRMNIKKPIHVFENISDIDSMEKDSLNNSKENGMQLREKLASENVILYCGRLYPKKGSFGLFDAFNKINKNYGNSKLILLGCGENSIDTLIDYGLKRENLKDIIFVPWIKKDTLANKEEFLKYYYASDVLVQPMITERLYAKTVIDAMAIGLPAISCKSEYTIGTSRNAGEIFNSFVQFKENPEEVKKIINKAKKKVQEENTWNNYISKMRAIVL